MELNDIRNKILVDNKFESLKKFIRNEMQSELDKLRYIKVYRDLVVKLVYFIFCRENFTVIQGFYKSERSILSQSSAKARADCLLENMNCSLAVIKQQIGDKTPLEVKQFEMKKVRLYFQKKKFFNI